MFCPLRLTSSIPVYCPSRPLVNVMGATDMPPPHAGPGRFQPYSLLSVYALVFASRYKKGDSTGFLDFVFLYSSLLTRNSDIPSPHLNIIPLDFSVASRACLTPLPHKRPARVTIALTHFFFLSGITGLHRLLSSL